jgi:hypothetical protein
VIPSLVLVGMPGPRWVPPLPLPLFLLWPLVPLGLGLAGLMRLGGSRKAETVRTAALMCCHLRGLTIDVRSADRERVHIRFV